MKRKFFNIFLVCLLAMTLMTLTPIGVSAADPVYVYGTERYTGDVWRIDVANGTYSQLVDLSTLPSVTPSIIVGSSTPNGVALDSANMRYYFASFTDPGSPPSNSVAPSELYFIDLDAPTAVIHSGQLIGHSSDATFYDGKYWYIGHGTDELQAVSFNPDGTILSEVTASSDISASISNSTGYLGFGDIAFDLDGTLFVSATLRNVGNSIIRMPFGSYDTSAEIFTDLGNNQGVQIAFGTDGKLYAHSAGSGEFYTIDTVTGVMSAAIFTNANRLFGDLASDATFVPEPDIQIEKSGLPTSTTEGSTINYTYTITNTGNVPLSSVDVNDNLIATVTYQSGDDGDNILQTTETWIYTGSYEVPWFSAGPVDNTATAEGWWEQTKVEDEDDFSVTITHNPDISVNKQGPPSVGYFLWTEADYTYRVTNTGDCALDVELSDDLIAVLNGPTGDDGNGYLDPRESWTYTATQTLECTDVNFTDFVNTATANGTDATGYLVSDQDDWTVTIFQWLPGRTIGYWSNWDNHFSEECITEMVDRVDTASTVFNGLDSDSVYEIIKGQDQKGKMTVEKARVLLSKQLMAAWLNVISGRGATDEDEETCGSMDAALWEFANVYLTKVPGAASLFGAESMTVIEVMQTIEANYGSWTADQLLLAQSVLDKMNNAQENGYFMFMP